MQNADIAGRSYNELDELYERGIPAWRFKETATAAEKSGSKTARR